MNKTKYQSDIFHDDIRPRGISFFKPLSDCTIELSHVISFFIPINSKPILILDCYEYINNSELYEYGINYIIDNKIGKYSHLTIFPHSSHNIIAYFDIIDKELLLQLI